MPKYRSELLRCHTKICLTYCIMPMLLCILVIFNKNFIKQKTGMKNRSEFRSYHDKFLFRWLSKKKVTFNFFLRHIYVSFNKIKRTLCLTFCYKVSLGFRKFDTFRLLNQVVLKFVLNRLSFRWDHDFIHSRN